ncbi:phage capsid protein [Paraburkholderia silviterrae]|uniref:Phage capsid protein n=1 Tax=Paraburkholderia silviterrae TaxID=2528715 RepID=A0A4R5M9F0_9BURK|nr:phage capsid protein [Paraburkholderia silviterrae]TDG23239.1 phage capsid protein [Paraburkholderia silviterrae]
MHISKRDVPGETGAGAPDAPPSGKPRCRTHGMVLKDSETDYRDLTEFGRITIERDGFDIYITVDGFKFEDVTTGRQQVAKALAWGRDTLAAKLEAVRLVPGGGVVAVSGMTQDDLDIERLARREAS